MTKKYVIGGLVVAAISAVIMTASAAIYSECNYNSRGNYVSNDGTVSAYGTMESAMQCALSGVLPQVVIERLGVLGTSETKEQAEHILVVDEESYLKNEELKKESKEK
jgi:hypothetical protein